MSSIKCGLKYLITSIIFIAIVNGYAKDISGVERDHVRLNEYISHYERLDYDHLNVRASHHRARRSVTKDRYVHLKFQAHGQDFHIRLKRDLHTFSDKLEIIDSNNAPLNILTDHIYVGNVIGDRNSYVFGSILDGIFEGKIITARDVYYVEHAKRYFPANFTQQNDGSFERQQQEKGVQETPASEEFMNSTTTTTAATTATTTTTSTTTTATATAIQAKTARRSLESLSPSPLKKSLTDYHDDAIKTIGFHSVIYKDSHVQDAYEHIRDEGHVGGCGITDEVSQWMENIQNSAVEELPEPMSKDVKKISKKRTISTTTTATTTTATIIEAARATTPLTTETETETETIETTEAMMITLRPNKSYYNDKIVHHSNEDDVAVVHDDSDDAFVDDYNKKNVHEKEIRKTELLFHNDQHNIVTTIISSSTSSNSTTTTTTVIDSNRNNTHKLRVVKLQQQQQQQQQEQHQKQQQPQQQRILFSSDYNVTQATTIQSPHKYKDNKSNDTIKVENDDDDDDDDDVNVDEVDDDDNYKYSRPYQKYTKDANIFNGNGYFYNPETGVRYTSNDWHEHVHERIKRASGGTTLGNVAASRAREDNKNTCSLYIQTDPLIWRHIREGIADHDRSHKYERDIKTREEITSLIAHHVTAVNYIYRNTKFDGRTEHRNIRFEVQRIKIDDDSACRSSYNGPHNAFCNEHMDVSNFLNLHSLEDHSDFCLAYVFTYRDFSGGTLGLAWVASASGASGGICEKYKTYTETVGGQYQSTKRSLNTGIITFVNYNSRVPPKVSQLTLAHEIGHNFGSPHDYPQECRPGGLNGNFIMFASATSGDRPNNSKFSSCSIRNISHVLDVLVGNMKRDCFQVSEGAFCGNKIVEQGEECDCGFNEDECKDNCCYPRLISEYDMSLNSTAKGCTRRAKTQCSPSQGPCCLSNSCTFVPAHYQQKCKEETECSWLSICNGTTAECPEPKPRDDKTKCNNGTALCIGGECSGSICLLWNMSECFLTSQVTPHVDKRKLCELACQNGNDTGTCRSTSEFAHLYGLPVGGISLRPGSPCDNFQGYCDVFLKCRAVDADGPLVRLKNLLLNRETLLTVAQWVTENWYIVVLMGIGFIIVMGAFIKCCAVHTPSSNPKKRRARRISETLRAPMNTLRRMRHPHSRSAGGARSIPPVHEGRSQHRNYPPEWDRAQRSGGNRTTAAPSGRSFSANGSRNIRGSASRQANAARPSAGGHGYADGSVTGAGSGASVGGIVPTGLGPNNSSGDGGGSSVHLTATAGVTSAVSAGVSRSQLPLPALPSNVHQQQQQQLPQQSYYAPKVEVRNKSRSSRSSTTQPFKNNNSKQTTTKRTSSPTKRRNQTKEHKMHNQKSGNSNKIRRNIVY